MAGLWRRATKRAAAFANPIGLNCRAIADLFVHEVVDVSKGDLENELVRTVRRDGSAKFSNRRGR